MSPLTALLSLLVSTSPVNTPAPIQVFGVRALAVALALDSAHCQPSHLLLPDTQACNGETHVNAVQVICRFRNAKLGNFSCEITKESNGPVQTINGGKAYDLITALLAAGLGEEGAAGTIYVGSGAVSCSATIQNNGGACDRTVHCSIAPFQ